MRPGEGAAPLAGDEAQELAAALLHLPPPPPPPPPPPLELTIWVWGGCVEEGSGGARTGRPRRRAAAGRGFAHEDGLEAILGQAPPSVDARAREAYYMPSQDGLEAVVCSRSGLQVPPAQTLACTEPAAPLS